MWSRPWSPRARVSLTVIILCLLPHPSLSPLALSSPLALLLLLKIRIRTIKECDRIVQAAASVPSPKNKSHQSPMAGMVASPSSKLQVSVGGYCRGQFSVIVALPVAKMMNSISQFNVCRWHSFTLLSLLQLRC